MILNFKQTDNILLREATLRRLILGLLFTLPVLAQPQIGGGTCSSASLSGTYAVSISGRQVSSAGVYTGVLQAIGSATFDGLSSATFSLTPNTNQSLGSAFNWSGSYSVQANCVAVVNIASANAALNIMIYNQGKDFQFTGNDATYGYSGSGVSQAAGCSTSTLNGVYVLNATGYLLSDTSVSGVVDTVGLMQFDGQGNVTLNSSGSQGEAEIDITNGAATYTISSDCTGTAMSSTSETGSNPLQFTFNVYSIAPANTNFYLSIAQNGKFLVIGGGHTAFGEPSTASRLRPAASPRSAIGTLEKQ